jgi:hypothetical protein
LISFTGFKLSTKIELSIVWQTEDTSSIRSIPRTVSPLELQFLAGIRETTLFAPFTDEH